MKFRVKENIKKGDVIGYDIENKKIKLVRTNEEWQRLAPYIENSVKDLVKNERIDVHMGEDYEKMERTIAAIGDIKKQWKSMPEGPEKEKFKYEMNKVRKKAEKAIDITVN